MPLHLEVDPTRLVELSRPAQHDTCGAICGVGRTWVLLHVVDDLHLDGWACVRRRDVHAIAQTPHLGFAEKVLARGLRRPVPRLDLDSTGGLLRALGSGRLLGLDREAFTGGFFLARVLDVDVASAFVHPIDPAGCWWDEGARVPFSALSHITFDTRYNRCFQRHGQPWSAPSAARLRLVVASTVAPGPQL